MGTARSLANHSLYLARILLAAWRRDEEAGEVAGTSLVQAYLPAVRGHLARSYGWFLLDIQRIEALPATPPTGVDRLPPVADGKALPPELNECRQLERDGWLGDMLNCEPSPATSRAADNLAIAAPATGRAQLADWAGQLQQLYDRMGDSLDEY